MNLHLRKTTKASQWVHSIKCDSSVTSIARFELHTIKLLVYYRFNDLRLLGLTEEYEIMISISLLKRCANTRTTNLHLSLSSAKLQVQNNSALSIIICSFVDMFRYKKWVHKKHQTNWERSIIFEYKDGWMDI